MSRGSGKERYQLATSSTGASARHEGGGGVQKPRGGVTIHPYYIPLFPLTAHHCIKLKKTENTA